MQFLIILTYCSLIIFLSPFLEGLKQDSRCSIQITYIYIYATLKLYCWKLSVRESEMKKDGISTSSSVKAILSKVIARKQSSEEQHSY